MPKDAAPRVVRDAGPSAADAAAPSPVLAVDAAVASLLDCRSTTHETRGRVIITADASTLRGEFLAFDTTRAPTRDILLRAQLHDDSTTFVFDGYGDKDSTFKGHAVPRADHFERGKDVIVRIELVGGERRLVVDGAFQFPPAFDNGTGRFGYRCQ